MSVKKELFGKTKGGEDIYAYTIEHAHISARVINYGAALVNLCVPDKNGTMQDIVLGYDDADGYFVNSCFFGALVAPVANRTAGAEFSLDGVTYHLPVNDGPNNLHTDHDTGAHKKIWKAIEGEDFVTFTLFVPDGEYGLPGNKNMSVTYSVTDANGLRIHYHITSDRETILNPTNHAYFNLDGHNSGDILGQYLQIFSFGFTAVGEGSIPTGEIRGVEGTPFDFLVGKPIGRDIEADDEQLKITGGFDHNYCIEGYEGDGKLLHAAMAFSTRSGRQMDVYTTLPGVQFYAGNYVDGEKGKEGAVYGKRDGFCLETQYYPDTIHHSSFPGYVFGPDNVYDSTTEYRFSIR